MSVQHMFFNGVWVNQANMSFLNGIIAGSSQTIPHPISAPGVFGNFKMTRLTAVAAAATQTWTIKKTLANGGATSNTTIVMSFAAGATVATDTTHFVSFNAGDEIWVGIANTGTPGTSEIRLSCEFTPTESGVSIYGFGDTVNATSPFVMPVYGWQWRATSGPETVCVVTIPCTIIANYLRPQVAPGGVATRFSRIKLNTVEQDGSGVTVNTTATVSGTNTQGHATAFALNCVPGDLIEMHQGSSGVPAGINANTGGVAIRATDGQAFMFAQFATGASSSGTPNFSFAVGGLRVAPTTPESSFEYPGGLNSFVVTRLYAIQSGTAPPGAGKSRTTTLRQNGANTQFTVTISGTTPQDGNVIPSPLTISPTDTWAQAYTATGAPATSTGQFTNCYALNELGSISVKGVKPHKEPPGVTKKDRLIRREPLIGFRPRTRDAYFG